MVQLKLTLKSKKPSNVYALNGKSYRLQPGKNTLNLEYDDYVSLAKALGIKPVEKDAVPAKETKAPAKEPEIVEKQEPKQEPVTEEPVAEEPVAEEPAAEAQADDHAEDTNEEPESSGHNKEIDYASWSYNQLKKEYKRVTGNTCRMKKADVIQFLQELN